MADVRGATGPFSGGSRGSSRGEDRNWGGVPGGLDQDRVGAPLSREGAIRSRGRAATGSASKQRSATQAGENIAKAPGEVGLGYSSGVDANGLLLDCLERRLDKSAGDIQTLIQVPGRLQIFWLGPEVKPMVYFEVLQSSIADALLRFWKPTGDPLWAAPSRAQLWGHVVEIRRHKQRVKCLDAEVRMTMLAHRLTTAGHVAAGHVEETEETKGQRHGRLKDFFSEFRQSSNKICSTKLPDLSSPGASLSQSLSAASLPRAPVPKGFDSDCMDISRSSPSLRTRTGRNHTTASGWAAWPTSQALEESAPKVLVGKQLAETSRSGLSWKERAAKSHCSAGGWELARNQRAVARSASDAALLASSKKASLGSSLRGKQGLHGLGKTSSNFSQPSEQSSGQPGPGLPPIKSRNSSLDPRHESEGRADPHIQSYLKAVDGAWLVPVVLPFVTGHSSRLNAKGRQLFDHDLLAIAGIVETSLRIDSVDLTDNGNLTDKSLLPLLTALMKNPAAGVMEALSLQRCHGAGNGTTLRIAELLESPSSGRLCYLNLNGVQVGAKAVIPLCKAIGEHGTLTSVNVADIGLNGDRAPQCVRSLIANRCIDSLDLGWNCFTAKTFSAIGECLSENRTLRSLSLASCAESNNSEGWCTPLAHFIEHLSSNQGLTRLDISLNRIDFRGALIIEDALQQHRGLSFLNVSHNPLGSLGMRSMLRLLSGNTSGLTHFSCEECNSDLEGGAGKQYAFSATNPGGSYMLNLSTPYHRSLLRMLCKTCDRLNVAPSDIFTNTSMKPSPYVQPEKGAWGIWKVPTNGKLTLTFSIEKALGRGLSDKWKFGPVLQQHMHMARTKPCFRKVVHLLAQWRSISNLMKDQQVMLGALSKDFVLQPSYIEQMCRNREIAGDIVWGTFPCVDDGKIGKFLLTLMSPSLGHCIKMLKQIHRLFVFNLENPTGHYRLDLSNPADSEVAGQLLLLNRWEILLAEELKRVDTSQRGRRSFFLNEVYQERPLGSSVAEWNMPEIGFLEFDYVTGKRQAEDAKIIDEQAFGTILSHLNKSECPVLRQVDVLRIHSHHINLKSVQLRSLLGIYESSEIRADLFILMYFQVVDIQNEKIFRVGLPAKEYASLQQRLGHATLFPFIQPEQLVFQYDMSYNDQRLAALVIFKLCQAEKENNLKEAAYTSTSGNKQDAINFWRASKEASLEKCPWNGVFKGKYICAPEDRNFKARVKLLETYGFWQLSAPEGKVLWWASVYEAPGDVLEFIEWLLPRYPDLSKAFYDIDGSVPGGSVSNGEVTLKEFEGGLAKMGCNKFAGPNEKASILGIFKYLDPTGEGSISLGEWSILEALYREICFTIREFIKFLRRTAGETLEQWWSILDEDGSGQISYKEFQGVARTLGYFGATKQLFSFIDKDDEGNICFDEFKGLGTFESQPSPA